MGRSRRPTLAALLRSSFLIPPQPRGRPADPGLFGPGSVTWAVCRERAVLAGGQATLLLQVAHPLIAAGVADHSTFREDTLGRLRGTLQATLTALFGDTEQAHDVARRVGAVHGRVHGTLRAPAAPYPAGAAYDAHDPELGRWVHATLVATMLRAREVLVGKLDQADRARYHEELKALGTLFGVPAASQPNTFDDFEAYIATMVSRLTVGDDARSQATLILDPPRPWVLAPAGLASRLVTAELLPEPLRRAYGLPDDRLHRAARAALVAVLRAAVHTAPPRLRYWPHYRTARARVAAMDGPAGPARGLAGRLGRGLQDRRGHGGIRPARALRNYR